MKNLKLNKIILVLILVLACFLRLYRLNDVPAGFHQDEVSQAYNAFAIATTGFDRYGEFMPILFRSFGSYQPSVYTYLSTIPVTIFGNTIFAARFLSAISGVGVVLFAYLIIVSLIKSDKKYTLALSAAFILSISPWAIHFSRRVVEGNVGLFFFLFSLYLFIHSLKKIKLLPVAMLVLGIATHAYYSERLIAVMFVPLFIFVYRDYFLKHKKVVFISLILFFLTLIPHIWILTSGAFARRFDQVSYFSNDTQGLPRFLYITIEFIRHFLGYISPKNLFADTGSGLARVSPDLGVFFEWMFLPFLLGLWTLIKSKESDLKKILIILFPISLVPASLTGDIFYPLRALVFLFLISVIITLGILPIYDFFKNKKVRTLVLGGVLLFSYFNFYISYFVLFQYETTEYVGGSYIKLNEYLEKYKDKNIVIDSARDFAIGLRIAYLNEFPAGELAKQLRPQLTSSYYSSEVGVLETYKIDNIIIRPLRWGLDSCSPNTLVIGDEFAISSEQATEHKLKKEFVVNGNEGNPILVAYSTHPDFRCN